MSWLGSEWNKLTLTAKDLLMQFPKALENKDIILLDGAIGTELGKRGLMGRASNNLDAPEAVLEIQREYASSGCDALTTNTLTMNQELTDLSSRGCLICARLCVPFARAKKTSRYP